MNFSPYMRRLFAAAAAAAVAAAAATTVAPAPARADFTRTYTIQGGDIPGGEKVGGTITTTSVALGTLATLAWDIYASGPYINYVFTPTTSYGGQVAIPLEGVGGEFYFVGGSFTLKFDMDSAQYAGLLAGAPTVELLSGYPTLRNATNYTLTAAGSASLVSPTVAVPAPEAGTGLAGLLGVAGWALLARSRSSRRPAAARVVKGASSSLANS
jgi:hypothetical protein